MKYLMLTLIFITSLSAHAHESLPTVDEVFRLYDLDYNGVIEKEEHNDLFARLKKELVNYIDSSQPRHAMAKSLYFYMIKKTKTPSPVQLLQFHVFGKKKKVVGTKENVTYLLQTIQSWNPPAPVDNRPACHYYERGRCVPGA